MKLVIFDLDDTLFDTTGQLGNDLSMEKLDQITPLPGAIEMLEKLKAVKVLVTRTSRGVERQEKKIDVLGIRKFFDKIIMTADDDSKRGAFEIIINSANLPLKDIFVVGNRIDAEVRYGKELGLKTILIKRGKYENLKPKDDYEKPDYTITDLRELFEIIR